MAHIFAVFISTGYGQWANEFYTKL